MNTSITDKAPLVSAEVIRKWKRVPAKARVVFFKEFVIVCIVLLFCADCYLGLSGICEYCFINSKVECVIRYYLSIVMND